MKKNIKISFEVEFIIKIIITLSAGFLSFMISLRYNHGYGMAGSVLSWLVMGTIMYTKVSIRKIDTKKLLYSIIPGLLVLKIASAQTYLEKIRVLYPKYYSRVTSLDVDLLRILGLPICLFLSYIFIDRVIPIITKFIKSLDKVEKKFLIISMIVAIVVAYVITDKTTAFTYAKYDNRYVLYDVIYTFDTTIDAFTNISDFANDVRNPLFGIMALPFSVVATFIKEISPFGRTYFEFATALSIVQIFTVAVTLVLLGRLLKLETKNKILFYIFCMSTMPYLIFSLFVEQYVISVFYLVLFIYVYLESKKETNYLYVAATGSILTSGIMFPLITKVKKIKDWIKNVFDCFLVFVSCTIIGGQLPQVFEAYYLINSLLGDFAGGITTQAKLYRFTYFIKDIFFITPGVIKYTKGYPQYLSDKPISISIIGIALLIICLISVYLNRKNKYALISGFWVLFSIILLYVVGWGAPENGFMLYSYYFSWAYLSLYYLFFKKIFENKKKWFNVSIITTISIMLIVNIPVFYKILEFAFTYYK